MQQFPPHSYTGRLIVLEGVGGAGKGTQNQLLFARLQQKYGEEYVYTLHLPRYEIAPYGPLIRQYLDGNMGDPNLVDPKIAGTLYALDRTGILPNIIHRLKNGQIILLDRYISSNLAYQGAKIANLAERERYLSFQMNLEYHEFKAIREDLLILLHAPVKVSMHHAEQRGAQSQESSAGLDGHEKDIDHVQKVINLYRELVVRFDYWQEIDCATTDRTELRPPDQIAKEIWQLVEPILP